MYWKSQTNKENIIKTYLGELMLWHGTSLLCPKSSWLRSTIPHGAIPILTTLPVLCWPSKSSASPTCFVTPAKYKAILHINDSWCSNIITLNGNA